MRAERVAVVVEVVQGIRGQVMVLTGDEGMVIAAADALVMERDKMLAYASRRRVSGVTVRDSRRCCLFRGYQRANLPNPLTSTVSLRGL